MQPEVSKAATAALQPLLVEAQASGQLPSVVAGTFYKGTLIWSCSLGAARQQYRIGSITKTFTAVAVMRLRDEGRLDLNDPIGRHVADAPYRDRTIRALLSHSSGMTAEPAGPWWERSAGSTWQQLVDQSATGRAVFGAGERFHYSNLAFALLGELVARLRGRSWFDAIRTEVLAPLALSRTTYDPIDGAAVGTSRDPRDGELVGEPAHDAGVMAPAGQLWSTTADLAGWADFLAAGDDRVLSRQSLVEMRTVQSGDPDEQHLGAYGLGLRLDWSSTGTLIGHTGSMPGFLAALFVEPSSRVGSVVLTNATTGLGPSDLHAQMIRLTADGLGGIPLADSARSPEGPALPAAEELAGAWYWGNSAFTLIPTADGFVLDSGVEQREFRCQGVDAFVGRSGYFAGERLSVMRRGDDSVSHLEVVTFVLTRVPYDPAAPIPGGPPIQLA